MVFDRSKGDKFAIFEVFPDEVALVFNKKSEDSVRNWHKGLLNKRFIKIVDEKRNLYTVKSPLRYVVGLTQWGGEASKYSHEEANQSQEFILENIRFFQPESKKILPKSDNLALKSLNSTENSLSSSKDNSIISSSIGSKKVVVIKQAVRSDEEYQKIYDEGEFLSLTPDDMRWIDENAKEEVVIENEEMEKEIVKVFFNGDWNEYRKNLIEKT
jgi:hypothetical protein